MTDAPFKYSIYTLEGKDGSIRYVGITKLLLSERLRHHIKRSRKGRTYRDNWIRSLGYNPVIKLLEGTNDTARETYWIKYYKDQGCRLTNLTEGGEGITGYRHTPEGRSKMSAKQKGKPKPIESRANYCKAAKERWANPEYRKQASEKLLGHEVLPETREKIGHLRRTLVDSGWVHPCTGRKHSDERRRKNSEAQLRRSAAGIPSPRKGFIVSNETRQKLREAAARRKLLSQKTRIETCLL